jgi:hypothetical protein
MFDEEERMKLEKESAQKNAILSKSTGFVETVAGLMLERIQTTTRFCPVCDAPHPLELLKPIVCEKELCGFQFSSLGVGCNVESEILHNPEVVDLLVSVTMAAATQGNRFEPFPKQVLMINKEKKEVRLSNAQEVVGMLNSLPNVDALVGAKSITTIIAFVVLMSNRRVILPHRASKERNFTKDVGCTPSAAIPAVTVDSRL